MVTDAAGTLDITSRLTEAHRRIAAAGGDLHALRIVAVTKGFGPAAVQAALAAGIVDVGENYAQELVRKHAALHALAAGPEPAGPAPAGPAPAPGLSLLRWHFLGTIQRNKVAALSPVVSCWQSVARFVEGEAVARRRPGARVLVEVETTGASQRSGCAPHDVAALVAALRALDLDVAGLMTVAPRDPQGARQAFRTVRGLADLLELPERSMGMSDDLELAVAEGSTMVRLGRALFGPRPSAG